MARRTEARFSAQRPASGFPGGVAAASSSVRSLSHVSAAPGAASARCACRMPRRLPQPCHDTAVRLSPFRSPLGAFSGFSAARNAPEEYEKGSEERVVIAGRRGRRCAGAGAE